MNLPEIRPITIDEIARLSEEAAADDHAIVYPSHIIKRGDEILGYMSLGLPTLHLWMSTKKATTLDSLAAFSYAKGVLSQNSIAMVVPIQATSPFVKVLQKTGMLEFGSALWTIAPLRKF